MDDKTFGDILKELIEERDMSQKNVAQSLHISPQTLGNYIRGQREPSFNTLKDIARYFGVSIDYLLNFHPAQAYSANDYRLLHLFHSMTDEQQEIYLEQGQAFVRYNHKKGEKAAK